MNVKIEVPDDAVISCLWTAIEARHGWFHEIEGLTDHAAPKSKLHPFRVKADDPKTNKARWYNIGHQEIRRGVALFIVRKSQEGKGHYVSGGWSNGVGELVQGSLDQAASDLLLQFMVWGEEVYA